MPRLRPRGPSPAKIMLVGEAPGEQENLVGSPFIGASGQELTRMLAEAGIDRRECYLTNVFFTQPPGNKIESFCAKKAEVGGKSYTFSPLQQGKYFKPEHLSDASPSDLQHLYSPDLLRRLSVRTVLARLAAEIAAVDPAVIVALGNTAAWALLGTSKISQLRGTACNCTLVPGYKVVPTFHPAFVLRAWGNRSVNVVDFCKVARESAFREIRRPKRTIYIDPTIDDLVEWKAKLAGAEVLSFDIETANQMIKCIGFAPNISEAYVIPFVDYRQPDYNYWRTAREEIYAWNTVRQLCALPCAKLAHNGMYDVQYMWRSGVPVRNFIEDTMILNHSLQPEMQKSLGFLGSVHTDEASWKLLRPRGDDVNKRDE